MQLERRGYSQRGGVTARGAWLHPAGRGYSSKAWPAPRTVLRPEGAGLCQQRRGLLGLSSRDRGGALGREAGLQSAGVELYGKGAGL